MRRGRAPRRSQPAWRRVTTDSGSSHDPTDVDAEDEEPETGPLRRCVVTRARLPKEVMFRFVVGPDRHLIPDLAGKLPGRGIWLSASLDVIEGAGGTRPKGMSSAGGAVPNGTLTGMTGRELVRAVSRAARGPVQVPPDLPVILATALIRRIGDLLGLTRRAGQAIAGFEKARDWMRTHPVGLVLQAADGSEAERTRFQSAVPDGVPVLAPLTGAELGRVFGHDNVVHVALARGRLACSIAVEAARLAGLKAPPALRPGHETEGGIRCEPGADAAPVRETGRETAGTNDVTDTNG